MPMPPEQVDAALRRSRILLNPERARVALDEVAPEHQPRSIGALDGIGFRAQDPDVMVSVYVFESQRQHQQAIQQLQQMTVEDEGERVLYSSNGPMLLFGHTRIDGANGTAAKYRLSEIVGAFSGDE